MTQPTALQGCTVYTVGTWKYHWIGKRTTLQIFFPMCSVLISQLLWSASDILHGMYPSALRLPAHICKAGFALVPKCTLKAVRNSQEEALPDYLCISAISNNGEMFLQILTSFTPLQCRSSTSFLSLILKGDTVVGNGCSPALHTQYALLSHLHAFLAWHQRGNSTNEVMPLCLLGMIYVPHAATLGEIILIYMMF